jgi:GTPase-associated system helical domain
MISKAFEWYRIVSATPNSEAVEARTNAAAELVAELSQHERGTLFAMAQGIARDFHGFPTEADTIEWLLRILKKHDPAVSENLSENKLELRCIAAITFGELLFRSKEEPTQGATIAAAAFVSAMNLRPLPTQRYIRAMLEELSKLAQEVLEVAADTRRKRVALNPLQDKELAVADLPTAKAAISRLEGQIIELEENAAMDREEISLFWFIATGFSRTKKKPFAGLPVSVAAVHAALEVYRFVLIPPALNCFEILAALVENKRKAKDLKPIPLSDHLTMWTAAEEPSAIAAASSSDADLASEFPAVFPITWIANRMREAQSLPNESEFHTMTDLRLAANLSATELSRQLLCEKVAASLMGELLE